MTAKKVVPQERDPRLKGLKQLKDLPAKEKPPGQSERALSKDELIQLFMKSTEDCVDLAGEATADMVPVLLFVQHALDQDDLPDEFKLRMEDGTMYPYCHAGNGAGMILHWVAQELHEKWSQIDGIHMKVHGSIRAIKEGKKPTLREPRA